MASENITREDLLKCIGIEIFATKGLAQYITDKKRAHVDAVLQEQEQQKNIGFSDPEKLSKVSRRTSHWSKERAQKLAKGYNELLTM